MATAPTGTSNGQTETGERTVIQAPPPTNGSPPRPITPWYRRTWVVAIAALILGIAIGSRVDTASKKTPLAKTITDTVFQHTSGAGAPKEGADNAPSAGGPTFKNGVLTTPDLKIQITRYKVIKAGQKGNEYGKKPVIAFWYKTTNLSGAKVDPTDFRFDFRAYQDNNPNAYNELEVGLTASPDDRFNDSQIETIKKGRTVENAIAYELDDLHTPVQLVATEGVGGEVIGKATYKLR